MKTYINMLYSIIDKIDRWEAYEYEDKSKIFNFYIEIKDNNEKIVDYFDKYFIYLSKIPLNSLTKEVSIKSALTLGKISLQPFKVSSSIP